VGRTETSVDELTLEELEELLRAKRRRAQARFLSRLTTEAEERSLAGEREEINPYVTLRPKWKGGEGRGFAAVEISPFTNRLQRGLARVRAMGWARARDQALLVLEIAALAGLLAVLTGSLMQLRFLNQEFAQAQTNPLLTPTAPALRVAVLPGGHSPPSASRAISRLSPPTAQPTVSSPAIVPPPDAPPHRAIPFAQPSPEQRPTPSSPAATRIVIPAIDVDAPVIQGDEWEELKQGVGHHPGSAQPGEAGNVVLSGHNDIFGQIFRHLEKLSPGDEIILYAGDQPYYYEVVDKQVVDPTEVEVMDSTAEPTLTLITCHPYLVDTQRLVAFAQLVEPEEP
jgi:sortase A